MRTTPETRLATERLAADDAIEPLLAAFLGLISSAARISEQAKSSAGETTAPFSSSTLFFYLGVISLSRRLLDHAARRDGVPSQSRRRPTEIESSLLR